MTIDEFLDGIDKGATNVAALASLLMVFHLEHDHGMTRLQACEHMGLTPEKVARFVAVIGQLED